ncbi:MAG: copper resistance protein B [Nitrospirae bacterium]|nr:copper resistance protein B [Nitrospirota bacterium]
MSRETLPIASFIPTLMIATVLFVLLPVGRAYCAEDETFSLLQAYLNYGEKVEGRDVLQWDGEGWIGKDYDKLWLKSRGLSPRDHVEEAEVQALYSRYIAEYWDLQIGARRDFEPNVRNYGVLSVQGLAPYFLETSLAAFVSTEGDLSARTDIRYDLLLTQRLIAQLYFSGNIYARDMNDKKVGAGLSDIDTGIRIRFEVIREFAPYLDFNYMRLLGKTADFAMNEGRDASNFAIQAGLRFWF